MGDNPETKPSAPKKIHEAPEADPGGGETRLFACFGTLSLTAADTTYTVTAKVGTASATLPIGRTTLIYGAPTQGLIDRIDLTLGGETYAQWSQRIFGSLVSQTDDADGDGRRNYDEYLAYRTPSQYHLDQCKSAA